MTGRVPVRRTSGHARRGRTIRRASAGLSPLRAGAALVMLLSVAAIYGVAASSVFGYRHAVIEGTGYTTEAAVQAALGLGQGDNLFVVRTDELLSPILRLVTVRDAHLSVELPDTVRIRLEERVPILVWAAGERRFLVDRDGLLFARVGDAPASATASLSVVDDRRISAAGLIDGGVLDAVDLDAATRLGSLHPSDVGSASTGLTVSVDDAAGFQVSSMPDGWVATFGFYSPTLRTPELIPGQVRLLRSLIGQVGEPRIATMILADDTDGTYTEKK